VNRCSKATSDWRFDGRVVIPFAQCVKAAPRRVFIIWIWRSDSVSADG
jgi:hypothetical protein